MLNPRGHFRASSSHYQINKSITFTLAFVSLCLTIVNAALRQIKPQRVEKRCRQNNNSEGNIQMKMDVFKHVGREGKVIHIQFRDIC